MQVVLPGEVLVDSDNMEYPQTAFVKLPQGGGEGETAQELIVSKISGVLQQRTVGQRAKVSFIPITDKYFPSIDNLVIGRVVRRQAENYEVDIRADRKAVLGALSFQGASKKSKPNLFESDLVFARVQAVPKYLLHKLTCVSTSNTKTWNSGEALFGQLVGGAELIIPLFFAHFLLKNEEFFEVIRRSVALEVVVGVNGVLWIRTPSARNTLVLLGFFKEAPYLLREKAIQLLASEISNLS